MIDDSALSRYTNAIDALTKTINGIRRQYRRQVMPEITYKQVLAFEIALEDWQEKRTQLRSAYESRNGYLEQINTHGRKDWQLALQMVNNRIVELEALAPKVNEVY